MHIQNSYIYLFLLFSTLYVFLIQTLLSSVTYIGADLRMYQPFLSTVYNTRELFSHQNTTLFALMFYSNDNFSVRYTKIKLMRKVRLFEQVVLETVNTITCSYPQINQLMI